MATFVLVHGAWVGGWAWRDVAKHLRGAGHEVFMPTLTGQGERVHLATPAVTLETHITDVVQHLYYERLREVILVGWSYGGMVITGVAEQAPERLAHLVYLDAFVPHNGDSVLGLMGPKGAHDTLERARTAGDGWRIPFRGTDLPRTDQPLATFQQPLAVGNPAATALPHTYILCTDKGDSRAFYTQAERARAAGWQYREIHSGHIALWTMPRELAALLLDVAALEPTRHDVEVGAAR